VLENASSFSCAVSQDELAAFTLRTIERVNCWSPPCRMGVRNHARRS